MRPRALIFDCDGVLADTEADGHRVAFNRMFAEVGLPVHWSVVDYAPLLRIGGGKERLASILTPRFVAEHGLPVDPDAQRALVAEWHALKTSIYAGLIAAGAVPPRAGVRRLFDEARRAGWRLAVASTSAERSVRAVLRTVTGDDPTDVIVVAGDAVARKKPAPDVYLAALDRLGMRAGDAVAIEDSAIGLRAALGAGLVCLVTVSGYTAGEDFAGASLVVDGLGDPGLPPIAVLSDAAGIRPSGEVTLADADAVRAAGAPVLRQETP